MFLCNHWLSLYKEDGLLVRELFGVRSAKTMTGDCEAAGTDCNVFIKLFGRTGITPRIQLVYNQSTRESRSVYYSPFARGMSSKFIVNAPSVGAMTHVRISHDGRGELPHWFLERLVVTDLSYPKWTYYFHGSVWLSPTYADRKLFRMIRGTREPTGSGVETEYQLTFYTGDLPEAATTADVFVQFHGESGISREMWLNDTPWQRSTTIQLHNHISFARGNCVQVRLPPCQQYGPLKELSVGHNRRGSNPKWYLEKIYVHTGNESTFSVSTQVFIRLYGPEESSEMDSTKSSKRVRTVSNGSRTTKSVQSESTEANAHTNVTEDRTYATRRIWLSDGVYERNRVTRFRIDLPVPFCISPFTRVEVGHDGSGKQPPWFLDRLVLYCPVTGFKQTFLCNHWLAKEKEDGKTVRTLLEDKNQRVRGESRVPWTIRVKTSKTTGAGTTSIVKLILYGLKQKTDVVNLDSAHLDDQSDWVPERAKISTTLFTPGTEVAFRADLQDIGIPYKLRIGHDNSGTNPAWHLERVTLYNWNTDQEYLFLCNRWLGGKHDDQAIVRELPAQGPGILKPASSRFAYLMVKFDKTDEFLLEAVDLKNIKRIRIGHDSQQAGGGWYLHKVVVKQMEDPKKVFTFVCDRWLDVKKDDGQTVRDLVENTAIERILYEIVVKTGDIQEAGTSANVFLCMYGKNGDTGPIHLKGSTTGAHKFKSGASDVFQIPAEDVGELTKIRLWHDENGRSPGWFLDQVSVVAPHLGRRYVFRTHRWLDGNQGDGKTQVDLEPTQIEQVDKGPKKDAQNSLESIRSSILEKSGSFNQMCCLRDEDGMENYWFIAKDWLAKDKGYCQMFRDLIATTEDGQILTRLTESTYEILVQTGTQENAGTTSRVYLAMYGSQAQSGDLLLNNLHTGSKLFSSGAKTVFTLKLCGLGELNKVKVYHDSSGEMPTWFLDHILITETRANQTKQYLFPCYQWLGKDVADGSASRVLMTASPELRQRWKAGENIRADSRLINSDRSTPFVVRVYTGTDPGAGTDSNVYLEMFGEQTSSGLIPLKTSLNQSGHSVVNKFEAGCLDTFTVKAMDIGPLKKIRLAHDSTGVGPSWQVARVEIDAPKLNLGWTFPCNRWLKSRTDRKMSELDLYPQPDLTRFLRSTMSFEVTVFTSEESSPLMTAAVFLQIYGQDGQSSLPIRLQFAEDSTTLFKRNSVDTFYVEVLELHMPVSKIRIWHDNNGVSPHWHVIETYVFLCGKWLSRGKVDGAIERELVASKRLETNAAGQNEEISLANKPSILNYEIRVITGNRPHAGTDANVYLTLFGENGDSGERRLAKSQTNANKFESGQTDVFLWEAVDLGQLHKARIRHDNSGVGPSWFLSRIEVQPLGERKMDAEFGTADKPSSAPPSTMAIQWKPTVFYCERWLSTHHEDSLIDRTLLAQDYQPRLDDSQSLTSIQTTADLNPLMKHALLPKGVVIFPRKVVDLASGQQTSEGSHIESTSENERLPTIPYHVRVVTGSVKHAGTTGPVWIRCVGRNRMDSGKMMLFHERRGTHLVKGSAQSFYFDAPIVDEIIEVEPLMCNKLFLISDTRFPKVCNESVGDKAVGWFLRSLDIDLLTEGKQYHLECNTWLSSKRADGKTHRCFPVTTGGARVHSKLISYHMVINTADEENAGLDSDVYLKLFGSEGTTHENLLEKCGHRFERGTMDKFRVEFEDVGSIEKLRLRYDAEGERRQWKLRDVVISRPGRSYHCGMPDSGWYSIKNDGLKYNWADLVASVNGVEQLRRVDLRIRVKTSNISGAATDSGVYLRLFGQHGDSGDLGLKTSLRNTPVFDKMQVGYSVTLSIVARCKRAFNLMALHAEWVEVQEVLLEATARCARQWRFSCSKWLSTKEGDQLLVRDLPCTEESINDPARGRLTDPVVINTSLAVAEVARAVNLPDRHYGDVGELLGQIFDSVSIFFSYTIFEQFKLHIS
ncbi:hypothetical protein FGIG_08324 [Fasciola gigantica]|uniref:PLAT domain-containing protein n=1 Tax=Fasciola gigantica TaxID=46835 RepID=A0A504YGR7_FASGI|nr:hypothetical protein FGIG_08324 [Fasciola gigantica]